MHLHSSRFLASTVATAFLLLGELRGQGFRTIASPQVAPDPGAFTLYLSPTGSDAWSGTLATPNAAGTDGPFATIGRAQERIREVKAAGLAKPITVLLRGGTYEQAAALVFGPEDSGTEACPITYQAYPGEIPVVSGGRAIGGWERDDSGQAGGALWRTRVPKTPEGKAWRFNSLFAGGTRRTRARTPNPGAFLYTEYPTSKENSRGFYFNEGDMQEWRNLRDVIVVAYHSWETSIHHIRRLDMEARQVSFLEPAPWPMGRWIKQQRYYVENVFEGLDQPGEWYLDQVEGILYYYPLPGERMAEFQAIAPLVTATLVEFRAKPAEGEHIEYLRFRGISFQHTNANLDRFRNPGQGEIYQPGMIQASGLRQTIFESCEMAHSGAHGIWLGEGSTDNRIERCHIHDLCGGGVYIGGGWGVRESTATERNVVTNCFIHEGGLLFHGAHGVWIGKSSYNQVTHNEISNLDYSGISCGWSWGFQPSSANHNNLDYNHIHHLSNGEGLSDMGGIYTLGVSPGTTERYNHIHDVYNYPYVSHGSGIYPDEGSTGILIENNVVYRVDTCPLFMHYGKECIVRNNVLAFGGKGQLRRSREDKRCHYEAVGNIAYGDIEKMLDGPWKNNDWKVGRNVYWSTAGEPTFAGMDFATWQEKGKDEGSIVADPLFVDPANGDFRLRPESPALELGFVPIDLGKTGLQGDPEWVALPSRYPNRARNLLERPVAPPFILNLDFEGEEPGGQPIEGSVITAGSARVQISDKEAAGGNQSLAFLDAEGLTHEWMPHIYYKKTYAAGTIHLSWDMRNSKEAPASFYIEARQYDGGKYVVGPTVSVARDGAVTASDREVGRIPLGEWAHVDIAFVLGEGAPKTYQLVLSTPAGEVARGVFRYEHDAFREMQWLGVASTSKTATVFHLDNLKMGTAEDLAQPIKRKPRRQRTRAARPLANDQQLLGHWSFEEGKGYRAADASGNDNMGEVWATWAKGEFGTAIFCDTAYSNVAVLDDPTLRFGTSDFTIEMWICPTQLEFEGGDPRRRFFSKNGYPATWLTIDVNPAGHPLLQAVDANKVSCSSEAKGVLPENVWTHLAVVMDRTNGEVRYYLNGTLDTTKAIPPAFTGSLDVAGKDITLGSTWQPFIGLLDEVKIHRRALSVAEIGTSYGGEKAKRTSAVYERVE